MNPFRTILDAVRTPHAKTPTVVAHRGGPGLGPHENTIEAFENAIRIGADMVEMDLRRTRDGELVAHHDPDIGGVRLADMSYFEASQAAFQKGYSVPLLRDVLAVCAGRIKFDFELKEVGYELLVVNTVLERVSHEDFILKSFHDTTVHTVKTIDPRITAGLLVARDPFGAEPLDTLSMLSYEARLVGTKADFLSPETRLVGRLLMTRARLLGKKVIVWTANEEAEMRRLMALGVDGIVTDNPHTLLGILGRNPATP